MIKGPSVANSAILLLAAFFLSTVSAAQLIDTKDASNISLRPAATEQVQATHPATKATPQKPCFVDNLVVKREHPENLRLEIVSVDTYFANEATEIIVTVRMKNEGHTPVLLPWQTDPVVPAKTGRPNDEVIWETGYLSLILGTQEHRAHGAALKGVVQLEAVPRSEEQHVRLLQGQWVEVRFKALTKCLLNAAAPPLCFEIKPDEHARLIARYNEWLYTRQADACGGVSSEHMARLIDSDPVEIDFVPANPLGRAHAESGGLSRHER